MIASLSWQQNTGKILCFAAAESEKKLPIETAMANIQAHHHKV
jgi:hypothetical protein